MPARSAPAELSSSATEAGLAGAGRAASWLAGDVEWLAVGSGRGDGVGEGVETRAASWLAGDVEWLAVGSGRGDGVGEGVQMEGPAAFVDRGVMPPAQQQQVIQVRGATVGPGHQVVCVCPLWRAVAAGEAAALVAQGEGAALGGADQPSRPAH